MPVSLRPETKENVRAVCGLGLRPEQREYVAPNVRSIAEAYVEPLAWPRAIYADEEPVGFLAWLLSRLRLRGDGRGSPRRSRDQAAAVAASASSSAART
ncbi:MAG TPA: hypothetical protein VHP82_00215, partial [Gaiellaceae bacterium]|nr:hypothetical protein [Gaiellaceae bacterium]